MFIQMMLKSMREATVKSDLVDSKTIDTYQSLYDKELSLHMAKRGVMGIADMLTRQLANTGAAPSAADALRLPQNATQPAAPGLPLHPARRPLSLQQTPAALVLPRPRTGDMPLQQAAPGLPVADAERAD